MTRDTGNVTCSLLSDAGGNAKTTDGGEELRVVEDINSC